MPAAIAHTIHDALALTKTPLGAPPAASAERRRLSGERATHVAKGTAVR